MATNPFQQFLNNYRIVSGKQPLAKSDPVGEYHQQQSVASPSAGDIAKWENWRSDQAQALAEKQMSQRASAERGSLKEYGYDNPSRVAAYNGHLYNTDDVRHYVDRGVFDNYDTLQNMADEYEKIKSYSEGENVLKKYYDKITNKSSKLEQAFDHFSYGNQVLKDEEESGNGTYNNPKDYADYMRYIFGVAKAKYGGHKL